MPSGKTLAWTGEQAIAPAIQPAAQRAIQPVAHTSPAPRTIKVEPHQTIIRFRKVDVSDEISQPPIPPIPGSQSVTRAVLNAPVLAVADRGGLTRPQTPSTLSAAPLPNKPPVFASDSPEIEAKAAPRKPIQPATASSEPTPIDPVNLETTPSDFIPTQAIQPGRTATQSAETAPSVEQKPSKLKSFFSRMRLPKLPSIKPRPSQPRTARKPASKDLFSLLRSSREEK
jgi:hypothetical protein